jgi:hypothetical protein
MSKRHRLEHKAQAAAARRVLEEGPVSIHDLAKQIGATVESLQRWIVEGRTTPSGARVFLDGLHRPADWADGPTGWLSSQAALARFLEATAGEATPPSSS